MDERTTWARTTFGCAELGDVRRTSRLVRMLDRAAQRPAGSVTEVFGRGPDRQAAYDLLESELVQPAQLTRALTLSTARACADHERVLVVLDGTSLSVTDRKHAKGLGKVGVFSKDGRGLKLLNAVALTTNGEPIGIADQQWWLRTERAERTRYRSAESRESNYWRQAVATFSECASRVAPDTVLHFVGDREADASLLIWQLLERGHEFTIRSNANRKVFSGGRAIHLRPYLQRKRPLALMDVPLATTPSRQRRVARIAIRAVKLDVQMRDHKIQERRIVSLTFVWARERGRGGVDWMLVTNTEVKTASDACEMVRRYTRRWRIEDFHRTWKSGLCGVEDTQLRSQSAITKWATILAAVAARAETLRHHARQEPDAPASTILSDDEIEALLLVKSRYKSRNETITAEGLTVKLAVRWIADIGGYAGNHNSGQPGPTTIGRGLEQVIPVAHAIAQLRATGKLR